MTRANCLFVAAGGPHVQATALQQAATCCDQVLTRGQFDRQLPSLLSGPAGAAD